MSQFMRIYEGSMWSKKYGAKKMQRRLRCIFKRVHDGFHAHLVQRNVAKDKYASDRRIKIITFLILINRIGAENALFVFYFIDSFFKFFFQVIQEMRLTIFSHSKTGETSI